MIKDKFEQRRELMIRKYWTWIWHFELNGNVWMQHPRNPRKTINVGKIEP